MPKRLSGWARLWIVILVPIWGLGIWSGISGENHSWERYTCDWKGCPFYVERVRYYDDAGEPLRSAADFETLEGLAPTVVAQERDRRQRLTSQHEQRLVQIPTDWTIGVVVAFLIAMIAKSAALWVWRGFRPPKLGTDHSR